jgi:hypothetical protein
MRSLIPVPQFLAVSACLLVATSLLPAHAGTAAPGAAAAAPATPAAAQGATQAPQAGAPGAPAAGRAGPMQLTSATPLAEHDYLTEKGVPHIWRVDTNGHDTAVMSNSLYHFAQKLFKE